MNRRFIVFFPSFITGGGEFLFKNIAEAIAKKREVLIVDIDSGWLTRNVNNVKVSQIVNDNKFFLNKNDILITSAYYTRYLDRYFEGDFSIWAWVIQPHEVIPSVKIFKGIQYKSYLRPFFKFGLLFPEYCYFKKYLNLMLKCNGLGLMDFESRKALDDYYKINFNSIVPIPVTKNKFRPINLYNQHFTKSILWLGRLDGVFKNPILIRLMEDLNVFAKESSSILDLKIIGTGPGEPEIRKTALEMQYLNVHFLGELKGEKLIEEIQNSRIGFAMGTSALEIAACAIPTILLDFSYSKIQPGYRYRWIFETTGSDLGRSIDYSSDKTLGNRLDMKDIFLELKDFISLSSRSYSYVKENHEIEGIADKVIYLAEKSEVRFSDLGKNKLFTLPYWFKFKRFMKHLKT